MKLLRQRLCNQSQITSFPNSLKAQNSFSRFGSAVTLTNALRVAYIPRISWQNSNEKSNELYELLNNMDIVQSINI